MSTYLHITKSIKADWQGKSGKQKSFFYGKVVTKSRKGRVAFAMSFGKFAGVEQTTEVERP